MHAGSWHLNNGRGVDQRRAERAMQARTIAIEIDAADHTFGRRAAKHKRSPQHMSTAAPLADCLIGGLGVRPRPAGRPRGVLANASLELRHLRDPLNARGHHPTDRTDLTPTGAEDGRTRFTVARRASYVIPARSVGSSA